MLEDLEQGDVAETVRVFFEKSTHLQPAKKSVLSLQDVSVIMQRPSVSSTCKGSKTVASFLAGVWNLFTPLLYPEWF
jgi:hypothetical protein